MASDVEISNTALAHLGSDAQVSSITPPDGSKEAGYASRFLPIARREMIEQHEWRFCLKRATLVELVTNPSTRWAFAYQLPSDCLKVRRVLTDNIHQGTIFTAPESYPNNRGLGLDDEMGAPFQQEGEIIYTNEPDAVLAYQFDQVNVNKWPPAAYSALGYLLASYMAGPVIRGKSGAATADRLRTMAFSMASAAAASDAARGQEHNDHTPQSVLVR